VKYQHHYGALSLSSSRPQQGVSAKIGRL